MRRFLLPLLALLGAACADATAPRLPGAGPPRALAVRVFGFGFGYHDVTLRGGDTLVVERFDEVRQTRRVDTVVPDAAAWRAFWADAERAGVARWPRVCEDLRIADGGGFTLAIRTASDEIAARGTNAYPRADGRCDATTTDEYRALLAAVARLVGRAYP